MDKKSKSGPMVAVVVALVAGLLVGVIGAKATMSDKPDTASNTKQVSKATDTKAANLRAVLNSIEREHVQLAAQATKAGFDGNANYDAAGKALFANSKELSDAVASVYGAEAGKKFNDIFDSHLTFFVNYTVAAKTGDKAGMDKAVADLGGYVDAISDFLSGANENLPREAVKQLFTEHVNLLKATVDAHGAANYPESFNKQKAADDQIGTIADALAAAIVKQNPEKF